MKQAVICIVPNRPQAEAIITTLEAAGFPNADISALMPDTSGVRDMGHEKHSKAPEGTSAGAGAGALIGGALGLLAGMGALAIPGVGPFIAAGPIMAALSGVGIGAATGGVAGGLIGFGIPEYEAKQYEGKLREGNILISVHTEKGDQAKRAEDIFKAGGAKNIQRTDEEAVKKS